MNGTESKNVEDADRSFHYFCNYISTIPPSPPPLPPPLTTTTRSTASSSTLTFQISSSSLLLTVQQFFFRSTYIVVLLIILEIRFISNAEEEEMSINNPEEEEEEEDRFYESLDQGLSTPSILSSSSAASSDDDENSSNYASISDDVSLPKFPMSTYEVWISEPASIEERRKRLLNQMGLSKDPLLSRVKPTFRSLSSSSSSTTDDNNNNNNKSDSVVVRSKSDTFSGNSTSLDCNIKVVDTDCVVNTSTSSSSSSNYLRSKLRTSNESCNGSPTANLASSPNKPPSGKLHHKWDEVTTHLHNSNLDTSSLQDFGDDLDCNAVDQICTIKNLDNGKEFVVNEIREDGSWNKVREVGTGRQLTMEEFESCVGHSPIVQELMRRQNVEQCSGKGDELDSNEDGCVGGGGSRSKKKGSWFRSIKQSVMGHRERRSSDERDTSSEKGGRRSSSATDDSQDNSFHGPERVRVRQYGKSQKDVTALYKCQEIQAHSGSIWTIKFSLDGRYLASAGEDCVIHVWQVVESERKGDLLMEKPEDGNSNFYFAVNGSPESALVLSNIDNHLEKKRRGRPSISRKSISLEHIVVPESVFALSEKPVCSFLGHLNDVLDLSWSKSQYLLSSSMDKTVRLWHMSSKSCLKVFSHSDYVTCIQFNPVDDSYFISGSLDAKVRIWSIPNHQVVDWNDLREMVTAACYTPDGQGALVGSYKGTCCLYNTSENKLHQKSHINLQNKKKRSHLKKITGFQFSQGSSSEVLITSADSRIRVVDGVELVHKFKGFRNTSSQISASMTSNGKYVVCASGDSYVYVWNHEGNARASRSKGVTVTSSYEHFHCQDVSVAIPWQGVGGETNDGMLDIGFGGSLQDEVPGVNNSPLMLEQEESSSSPSVYNSPMHGILSNASSSYFLDRISATWPEEKLVPPSRNRRSYDFSNEVKQGRSAWGMVIVTAGLRGEIKTFQNYGLPVRL